MILKKFLLKKGLLLSLFLVTLFTFQAFGQNLKGGGEANPALLTNQESLQKWQDLKFGMFIHWGPVTLRGTEIGWSRGREVPFEDYDTLYKEFNPVLFDAAEWVSIAKAAGMKYLVLVTKHHDGFSLWNSGFTDYDIMATPFHRDVVQELSDECRRQGLLFGTYYSILDWHHPDYPFKFNRGKEKIRKEHANMPRYIQFLKNQVQELIEKYPTRILWFDGEWEKSWTHQMGMDLYRFGRELSPGILINNRVDKGRNGMEGASKSSKFAGDFETPEQRVGRYNLDTPWESCITICKQWAWKPNDKLKSLKDCIQTLARTAGGGGNLLLNVGPMLDGRIEQRQITRLQEIGNWLKKYGNTIYKTQGGPVAPQPWGVTTRKGKNVYLHILASKRKNIFLPEFGKEIQRITVFSDQREIKFQKIKKGWKIQLPKLGSDEIDFILTAEIAVD